MQKESQLGLSWAESGPTFAVRGIPMDGGIAALAFTLCFSIPVFTLGVFSTNKSLCAEVITWRRETKEVLI